MAITLSPQLQSQLTRYGAQVGNSIVPGLGSAAAYFGTTNDPAVSTFRKAFDPSYWAGRALGLIGGKQHGLALQAELQELQKQLRTNPARALCRIGGDLANLQGKSGSSSATHRSALLALLQRAGVSPAIAAAAHAAGKANGGCAAWSKSLRAPAPPSSFAPFDVGAPVSALPLVPPAGAPASSFAAITPMEEAMFSFDDTQWLSAFGPSSPAPAPASSDGFTWTDPSDWIGLIGQGAQLLQNLKTGFGAPAAAPGMGFIPAPYGGTGKDLNGDGFEDVAMGGPVGPGAMPGNVAGPGASAVALCAQVEQLRHQRDAINEQLKGLKPLARKANMLARLMGLPVPAGCPKWVHKRRKPCRRGPYAYAPRRCRPRRPRRSSSCAPRRRRSCGSRSAAQRRFAAAARRFGGRIPRGTRLH